jgi:hypothetical protein
MKIIGGPPPNVVPHYREITAATIRPRQREHQIVWDVGSLLTESWIGLFC